MTSIETAGLLLYRTRESVFEILLAHPGGPFFRNKDAGSWTIPKGTAEESESILETAIREFKEETGFIPEPPFHSLGTIKQKNNKIVHVWAFEGDADPQAMKSNTFSMEWPPKSATIQTFPEVDRVMFFSLEEAREKIHAAQLPFLERLLLLINQGDFA